MLLRNRPALLIEDSLKPEPGDLKETVEEFERLRYETFGPQKAALLILRDR